MSEAPKEPRKRLALSHLGGEVEIAGPLGAQAEALGRALDVVATETAELPDVHGFHSYPARMHPTTAARLIDELSEPGDTVLDPFAGSGTVLVEAQRAGRVGRGYDINPLTAELVWLKTLTPSDSWLESLLADAERVAAHADERRERKARPTERYPEVDLEAFPTHVLLELDGVRDGIRQLGDSERKRALSLVLSALLTKFSRRAGDSSQNAAPKRIAAGFPARFFVKKTLELTTRLRTFRESAAPAAARAACGLGDARKLSGLSAGSVKLVVTSPPYPGVYDYSAHHADRLRWLGLADPKLEQLEIGSRSELGRESFAVALSKWQADFAAVLSALGRSLEAGGQIVLLIADSTLSGRALFADEVVANLAPRAGLFFGARASQARPHFHQGSQHAFTRKGRREHLLLLRRAGAA